MCMCVCISCALFAHIALLCLSRSQLKSKSKAKQLERLMLVLRTSNFLLLSFSLSLSMCILFSGWLLFSQVFLLPVRDIEWKRLCGTHKERESERDSDCMRVSLKKSFAIIKSVNMHGNTHGPTSASPMTNTIYTVCSVVYLIYTQSTNLHR